MRRDNNTWDQSRRERLRRWNGDRLSFIHGGLDGDGTVEFVDRQRRAPGIGTLVSKGKVFKFSASTSIVVAAVAIAKWLIDRKHPI